MSSKYIIDGHRFRLFLSTGRTGTTQIREYLKKYYPELTIWFEPPPSRELYLLWNAEQYGLLPRSTALRILKRTKSFNYNKNLNGIIVEFDSYLSPLVCDFIQFIQAPVILHLVRHPYTWIQSIANFKAASWRKYAVDILPFTSIIHPQARKSWRHLNKIQKLAWSWRLVNEKISNLQNDKNNYKLFRFEDYVSTNTDIRTSTLRDVLSMIFLDKVNCINDINIDTRMNKSETSYVARWQDWPDRTINEVNNICEFLMRKYGYEIYDK